MSLYRLALLTFTVMAATALIATTAHAQMEPAEVSEETLSGNAHCDPCIIHVVSAITPWTMELFGEAVGTCHTTFDMEVSEDGTGELTNQVLTGPGCGFEPCTNDHWPIEFWEAGSDDFRLDLDFCVKSPLTGPIDCHTEGLEVFRDHIANHYMEFRATAEACEETPDVHISGHWIPEGPDHGTLEIEHM